MLRHPPIRTRWTSSSDRRRAKVRASIGLELGLLERRVMLDATPTMAVGAGTIFTQLPALPEGTTTPFVTPSDEPVAVSNIVNDTTDSHRRPNVAPGSPAASEPIASNKTWSSIYRATRTNPRI